MIVPEFLQPVLLLAAALMVLALIEALIPLRDRSRWSRAHLGPNLALTAITVVLSLLLNVPLLLALVWFEQRGLGLFNFLPLPVWADLLAAVVALDLAWYATHRALHAFPALWRVHAVHHSDPMVDVTTAIRQHPLEGLVRYGFLFVFGAAFGVSPAGFALYRVWSAIHGQFDHANMRLPAWLDDAISWVSASPDMHKVHHARDQRLNDTNYSSILSVWDRLFGTFTPPAVGRQVTYGLDGHDRAEQQSLGGLLKLPFATPRQDAAQ